MLSFKKSRDIILQCPLQEIFLSRKYKVCERALFLALTLLKSGQNVSRSVQEHKNAPSMTTFTDHPSGSARGDAWCFSEKTGGGGEAKGLAGFI